MTNTKKVSFYAIFIFSTNVVKANDFHGKNNIVVLTIKNNVNSTTEKVLEHWLTWDEGSSELMS